MYVEVIELLKICPQCCLNWLVWNKTYSPNWKQFLDWWIKEVIRQCTHDIINIYCHGIAVAVIFLFQFVLMKKAFQNAYDGKLYDKM